MRFTRFTAQLTAAAVLFAVLPASANNNVEPIGTVELHGSASRLFLKGQRLFVATDERGGTIDVFDISNPERPSLLGNIAIGRPVGAVKFDGDRMYVATEDRLFVFDASRQIPQSRGYRSYQSRYNSVALHLRNGFAYIFEGRQNFIYDPCMVKRIDVRNLDEIRNAEVVRELLWDVGASNMEFRNIVEMDGDLWAHSDAPGREINQVLLQARRGLYRIAFDGDNRPHVEQVFPFVYSVGTIAAHGNILITDKGYFSFEDRDNVRVVSYEQFSCTEIKVAGDFLYFARGQNGFAVKNFVDHQPLRTAASFSDDQLPDVMPVGNYVFAAAGEQGLKVYRYVRGIQSINSATRNVSFGTTTIGESVSKSFSFTNDGRMPLEVGRIFTSRGLFNIDNEGRFELAGLQHQRLNLTYRPVERFDMFRDTLVIESNDIDGPLRVPLSIRSTDLVVRGRIDQSNYSGLDPVVSGDFAFILRNGVTSVDLTDRDNIRFLDNIGVGSHTRTAREGNRLYLAGYNRISVVDIERPDRMFTLGSRETDEFRNFNDFAVLNGRAVFAGSTNNPGLIVLDVEDPQTIEVVGRISNQRWYNVVARGNFLFALGTTLEIWDFENPDEPELMATLDHPRRLEGWGLMAFRNSIAYLTSGSVANSNFVYIIDLSNLREPEIAGSFRNDRNNFNEVVVDGRHLFIGSNDIQVYDLVNPLEPQLVYQSPPVRLGTAVLPLGGGLAFSAGNTAFGIYDFSRVLGIMDDSPGQRIELGGNWNLISLNISPGERYGQLWVDLPDIRRMTDQWRFGNFHQVVELRSPAGRFYRPAFDFNNIPGWHPAEGYWVHMTGSARGAWEGAPIDPQTPIDLHPGWNTIAYYPDYPLDASAPDFAALADIREHVILMKDGAGRFAIPAMNFSSLEPLRPGQGYMLKMDDDVRFVWPERGGDNLAGSYRLPPLALPRNTGSNMSLLVQLSKGDQTVVGSEVRAYSGSGRWVGSGRVNEESYAGLPVYGDDRSTEVVDGLAEGEDFNLRLIQVDGTEVSLVPTDSRQLRYAENALFTVDARTTFASPKSYSLLDAYPNPFNSRITVALNIPPPTLHTPHSAFRIRLYDALGRLVSDLTPTGRLVSGHRTMTIDAADLPSGTYQIRLDAGSYQVSRKITLLK